MNKNNDCFLSGKIYDDWFYEPPLKSAHESLKSYDITKYGIKSDGNIYTESFQTLIDTVYESGGGMIVVPCGTYITGALFFRENVNLCIEKGGEIMGSDDISDYPVIETRIEGETCLYYSALINADNIKGFSISGEGVINGNGRRAWKAFWNRRKWNPACLNKDEQRARLIYISNCHDVNIDGVTLKDSQFWTCHLYKCDHVKIFNCRIMSPDFPIKAPSTDAIDIDVCHDVHIKDCYMSVNDDAVALKGGKGYDADKDARNGKNYNILIENSIFEKCHSVMTCGSESIKNTDVTVRNIKALECRNLLWLKMRPDTPQEYSNILFYNIKAHVHSFLNINPWTQFFAMAAGAIPKKSKVHDIIIKNSESTADVFLDIKEDREQYDINGTVLEDLYIKAGKYSSSGNKYEFIKEKNVYVTETGITDSVTEGKSAD